ncbi:MAG: GntR family transcriptional regulator [Bacteroidales bacterium]|nr:GntR family transcriptional regulator [Bacteroidales bacterium]
MTFNNSQPIFIQIAQYVEERIIKKEYIVDTQIPSVRELASLLEVNPNTVMRAYERLQNMEVIYNKRGLGYFVSEKAKKIILSERRKSFFETSLPEIFQEMNLLEISEEELIKHLRDYNK